MDCYFYYLIIPLFVLYSFVFAFYFQLSAENWAPQEPVAIASGIKAEQESPSDIVVVVIEHDHNKNLLSEKVANDQDYRQDYEEEEEQDKEDDPPLYLCRSNSQSCGSITTMTLKNNHLTIETEETDVRLFLLLVLLY